MKTWYVYLLCDPDTELPFYVGKGTGNRIDRHAHTPENKTKRAIIQQIQGRGKEVLKKKVAEFSNEIDAYIYEWALINLYHQHLANIKDNGYYTLARVTQTKTKERPDCAMSLKEVSQQLGIGKQTVMKYINNGQLKGYLTGGRSGHWRVMESEIYRFLEHCQVRQKKRAKEDTQPRKAAEGQEQ